MSATKLASPFGANLRAALGATGSPRSADHAISLDLIDEDPGQPRSDFGDLEALASSIRLVGVLQPVGVRAEEGGRYHLVYGARRLRASRLAGKTTIPVHFVRDVQGLTAQVIENQHRKAFTNSEIAKAVNSLAAGGMDKDGICQVVNVPDYRFWYYRAFEKMPEWMVEAADGCEIRAIYDLYTHWKDLDSAGQEGLREAFDSLRATSPDQTIGSAKLTGLSKNRPELNELPDASAALPARKAGRKIARRGEAKPRLGLKVECRRLRSIVAELLEELSKTRRAAMEKRIQEIMTAPEGEGQEP